ncbi:hypothetical protein [Qipengyuania aquimaris]|uniref:hypothetical protein n=1 Tax=Qipengyuania aquimaris TaxID=255984 RepID=UPI001CD4E40C|nr:hypothetical protein [Qipengyuania aquimaris]MCA0904687.1 hypothetical protein [Qipengyuania aquimaris]
MSDPFTRVVARFTPHFLILFFIAAVAATIASGGPVIDNVFYGSWLLVAAAALVRFDIHMEGRK